MQIIVEGIALAAFGLVHQYSTEPLIKEITRYVMADEARHVAFGALSLAGVYDEMTAAERSEREDFVVEAAWLMRDRFLATEVWERLGIPLDDGLRDSASSPMLQLFQRDPVRQDHAQPPQDRAAHAGPRRAPRGHRRDGARRPHGHHLSARH